MAGAPSSESPDWVIGWATSVQTAGLRALELEGLLGHRAFRENESDEEWSEGDHDRYATDEQQSGDELVLRAGGVEESSG